MKKILPILILFISISVFSKAQDAFQTSNVVNNLYTNPGFAGSKNMMRISMNNQMTWYSALHKTMFNSVAADFPVGKLGIGVSGAYNTLSDGLQINKGDLMLSYKIGSLRKIIIRPGISASYFGSNYNFDKLVFYDQLSVYDGVNSGIPTAAELNITSFNIVDVSAGVVSQFPIDIRRTDPAWVNLGFAMHHIANNEYSSLGTSGVFYPQKYTAHGGIFIPMYHRDYVTKLRERSKIMFYPNFKYQLQGDFSLINVGMLAYRAPFLVGLATQTFQNPSVFNKNQIVATAGYETAIGKYLSLQLMYNLDWGSSFTTHLKNSPVFLTHEFSIVIIFANKRKTDCSTDLLYHKKRWFNSNEVQQRHEGECPPGKTPRRYSEQTKPVFYPFELPKAYIGF